MCMDLSSIAMLTFKSLSVCWDKGPTVDLSSTAGYLRSQQSGEKLSRGHARMEQALFISLSEQSMLC